MLLGLKDEWPEMNNKDAGKKYFCPSKISPISSRRSVLAGAKFHIEMVYFHIK